jgi:hypothetical protein
MKGICMSIILHGVVNDRGELQVEIPTNLPPGPVEIEIRHENVSGISAEQILSSEFVGVWADRDIDDSVEYVRHLQQRASRPRRET